MKRFMSQHGGILWQEWKSLTPAALLGLLGKLVADMNWAAAADLAIPESAPANV